MSSDSPENDKPQQDQGESGGRSDQMKSLGLLAVISSELLGSTAVGVGIGYLAWSKWGAPWWVLLLTSLLGMTMAFYRIYLMTKKSFGR